jgi:hypothetical protein
VPPLDKISGGLYKLRDNHTIREDRNLAPDFLSKIKISPWPLKVLHCKLVCLVSSGVLLPPQLLLPVA